jgi:hypothetical protein
MRRFWCSRDSITPDLQADDIRQLGFLSDLISSHQDVLCHACSVMPVEVRWSRPTIMRWRRISAQEKHQIKLLISAERKKIETQKQAFCREVLDLLQPGRERYLGRCRGRKRLSLDSYRHLAGVEWLVLAG